MPRRHMESTSGLTVPPPPISVPTVVKPAAHAAADQTMSQTMRIASDAATDVAPAIGGKIVEAMGAVPVVLGAPATAEAIAKVPTVIL